MQRKMKDHMVLCRMSLIKDEKIYTLNSPHSDEGASRYPFEFFLNREICTTSQQLVLVYSLF